MRETLPPEERKKGSSAYLINGKPRGQGYNSQKSKRAVDRKPFIAFDGEGRNICKKCNSPVPRKEGKWICPTCGPIPDDRIKHIYVLLKSSDGREIYNPDGLSTAQCLGYLLRTQSQKAIRVWYSFGYDVQQMCRDLPDETLVRLMHGQMVRYGPFRLSYMPGKLFIVNNIKFYDVFNFWQKSFVKAVSDTLGADAIPGELVSGKNARGDFAEWDISQIRSYTAIELRLLVSLCSHLREILMRADIHLGSAFYGPGAIANYWFKRYHISPPPITDPRLIDIMERAYYGGRFETFKLGRVEPIWEADINSAYPAILAGLHYIDDWKPCRATEFSKSPSNPYYVWHVEWHIRGNLGPFPSRDKHGLISYPANGIGWYWQPEVEAAIEVYGRENIKIISGYRADSVEEQPFKWVEEIYEQRLRLKSENDPAERGLKIGLNSLYGKTAQRVGKAPYFSLAWAGYITSATRAKLLRAAKTVGTNNVVAFATDAIYSTVEPRQLSTGKKLGQFSLEKWERGWFLQSGVYRLERLPTERDSGKPLAEGYIRKDAYRGYHVDKGIQDVFDQIKAKPHLPPVIYTTKFIGHLEAIKCPKALGPHRLSFVLIAKKIKPYETTKRKVLESKIWSQVLEDASWIRPGLALQSDPKNEIDQVPSLAALRDCTRASIDGDIYWNNYSLLLTTTIENSILNTHNDHSDFFSDAGKSEGIEESYPFTRITKREDDLALQSTDEISAERLGGASGIIPSRFATRLPIVNEEDIEKELTSGN